LWRQQFVAIIPSITLNLLQDGKSQKTTKSGTFVHENNRCTADPREVTFVCGFVSLGFMRLS